MPDPKDPAGLPPHTALPLKSPVIRPDEATTSGQSPQAQAAEPLLVDALPPAAVVAARPATVSVEPSAASSTPAVAVEEPPLPAITLLPVQDVHDLDETALRAAVDPRSIRSRMRGVVEAMEGLLDRAGGPKLLFDVDRSNEKDRAIQVRRVNAKVPVWIIGDLHGDLLSLEAALAVIASEASGDPICQPRVIFLGDLFDDEGFGLEVLLRVFELILDAPERVCVIAGNHDEALSYDGVRFASTVSPSDFADYLNAHLTHEWIERAGKVAIRLFAQAPRALFLPDGLLVAHGGFPLTDLHARLAETGDWNDPACLADFVWTRAHPTARRKLPNRYSRGSQYGYEDFAAFCRLTSQLGRPVTHMVRGHDHVDSRFAVYSANKEHPVLTTVALSRRLPREMFGPRERVPTVARFVEGSLPEIYRLHLPEDLIRELYPESVDRGSPRQPTTEDLA